MTFYFTTILWFIAFVLCVLVSKYHWNRRWLYYHASKIPGPFSFPLVGSAYRFIGEYEDLVHALLNIASTQPPIFKMWLGQELVVTTSRLQDLEIILNKCVDRGKFFRFGKPVVGDGMLTSLPTKWSKNRKIIAQSFSAPTLHSYIGAFNKQSMNLVQKFQNFCNLDNVDVYLSIFCCVLNSSCETLLDVDASLIEGQEKYINNILRMEKLVILRVLKIWCHSEYIWKRTAEGKEMEAASKEVFDFVTKILEIKKYQNSCDENSVKSKRFLNHLLNTSKTELDNESLLDETQTMLISSSETVATTLAMILMILGMYSEVQEKVYTEIIEVVGNNQEEITLDHITQMSYLDAVIKETMRICPVLPLVFRQPEEDVKLNGYTIPAGATILVPTVIVHKLPEYWKNPDQFNPDRFLHNKVNFSSGAFMPFSYGPRSCIGYKYAMIFMKVFLTIILKQYKFESVDYKSIKEIDYYFQLLLEPKKGFKLRLQKRNVL